jgi:putative GTP pyrophosphokinase
MTESQYKHFLRPYTRALRQILLDLEFFLEDVGPINVYSISSRIKSYKSALQKSLRLKIDIKDLHDLAGIRIVVATQYEVQVVARFFSRQEYSKDIEIESDRKISKDDGYRDRRIVILYKSNYARSMYPARIEVQIQTIFEHAFNFISRTWVYKANKSFSHDWQLKFQSLSDDLGRLDQVVTELHSEVIESSSSESDDEPLSPLSYQRIVHSVFGENISIEDAVDACRFLVDIGYITNGKLKAFFKDSKIHQLRERFTVLRSPEGRKFAQHVLEMSKYSFWIMFGVRYTETQKLLERLEMIERDKDGG